MCNFLSIFGDGNQVIATESVTLPAKIGKNLLFINADIVEKDIPLLLSIESMTKVKLK